MRELFLMKRKKRPFKKRTSGAMCFFVGVHQPVLLRIDDTSRLIVDPDKIEVLGLVFHPISVGIVNAVPCNTNSLGLGMSHRE